MIMATRLAWSDEDGQQISTANLREQAVRIIRAQVVSGRLEPGHMHSIGAVAEKLNVSITPVREALHDLAKEGLIEMRRNRGFLVRTPTSEELDDIVQVRAMLEVTAVREIAAKSLISDFTPLRHLCRQTADFAAAGDWDGFIETDREFHLSIMSALKNQKLVELIGSLRDQSRLLGLDGMAGTKTFTESTNEHELLLDAMEAGNSEQAATIMASHLAHVRGIWAGRSETPAG
jgi:DNA-binding GntR family transcriptional regulator